MPESVGLIEQECDIRTKKGDGVTGQTLFNSKSQTQTLLTTSTLLELPRSITTQKELANLKKTKAGRPLTLST